VDKGEVVGLPSKLNLNLEEQGVEGDAVKALVKKYDTKKVSRAE
jgi:hypothetical protein